MAEGEAARGRTRWLVIVIAILAIVILGRSQVGSRLLSLDPSRDEPPAGQIEGKVWRLDPDGRTLQITTRVFGIGATSVSVTDDTLVIVGSKEGGFGDLREGLHVRVAWDRRKDVRQARFVQVLDRPSHDGAPVAGPPGAPTPRRPERPAAPAASVEPPPVPSPVPPAAAPPALSAPPPPAEPRRAAPAPTVKAVPEPPRAKPTVKAAPESPRPAAAQLAPPPATRAPSAAAAPQSTAPAREPGPAAAPARDPDTGDSGAVIDWLLNQKD